VTRRLSGRRLGVVAGCVALLALALIWALAPPRTPPLFDGVGFPDEPYRYVVAPTGAKVTKPPTVGTGTIVVSDGKSRSGSVSTAEQGPQASLYLNEDALLTTGNPAGVDIRLTPIAAPSTPADGTIPGDAYVVSGAVAGGTGTVRISPMTNAATFLLRIPKATSQTVAIELLVGARWEQLTTFKTGTDVYSANLPALGTLAAVIVTDPARTVSYAGNAPTKNGGGVALGPLLAGVVVLALVLLVVGVRVTRRRRLRGVPVSAEDVRPRPGAPPQ
jgi:hypothetical protein